MTTIMRPPGSTRTPAGGQVVVPPVGNALLLARLHEESERQVPFSQAKRLLREAAVAIERLESELARIVGEREEERRNRQAP